MCLAGWNDTRGRYLHAEAGSGSAPQAVRLDMILDEERRQVPPIGSVRMRTRTSSSTTTLPCPRASMRFGRFVTGKRTCACGRRSKDLWNRMTEGWLVCCRASSMLKSVSHCLYGSDALCSGGTCHSAGRAGGQDRLSVLFALSSCPRYASTPLRSGWAAIDACTRAIRCWGTTIASLISIASIRSCSNDERLHLIVTPR